MWATPSVPCVQGGDCGNVNIRVWIWVSQTPTCKVSLRDRARVQSSVTQCQFLRSLPCKVNETNSKSRVTQVPVSKLLRAGGSSETVPVLRPEWHSASFSTPTCRWESTKMPVTRPTQPQWVPGQQWLGKAKSGGECHPTPICRSFTVIDVSSLSALAGKPLVVDGVLSPFIPMYLHPKVFNNVRSHTQRLVLPKTMAISWFSLDLYSSHDNTVHTHAYKKHKHTTSTQS